MAFKNVNVITWSFSYESSIFNQTAQCFAVHLIFAAMLASLSEHSLALSFPFAIINHVKIITAEQEKMNFHSEYECHKFSDV